MEPCFPCVGEHSWSCGGRTPVNIGLSQRWGCILLHIVAKAIAGLIAQNGLGWAGWLGWVTDRSQAVGLEFPAPCGCGP